MRIAMIGTRGLPATHGGVERAVDALSRQLAKRGHEVTVYGRAAYSGEIDESIYEGVRQIVLPAANTKHLEAASHTMLASARVLMSRGAFDLVHYHGIGPALFSGSMRVRRVPTVATVHAFDWTRDKWGPKAERVLKLGARIASTVPSETIVVSKQLQADILSAYGAGTTYIPNGVDFDDLDTAPVEVEGLQPGRFVLFLGRIVPEKQPHMLIEAFRGLNTDFKLAIAGPAVEADDYMDTTVRAAEGDPRIVFLGPRYGGEKAWLLRNARVFVQPSTMEGLPIALLEAVAAGTEVVASDIPANVEAVSGAGTMFARTFDPSSATELRDALAAFVSNRRRLVPDGRRHSRRAYDWDTVAAKTEVVYERALASRGGRRAHVARGNAPSVSLSGTLEE